MTGITCTLGKEGNRLTYEIEGDVTEDEYRGFVLAIGRCPHVAAREVTRLSHILVVIDLFDTSLPRDVDELIRDYFEETLGRLFAFKQDVQYRL